MKKTVKIRFNNECKDSLLIWRVLIDDVEHLASEVLINSPSFTSTDHLPEGKIKHHVSAYYTELIWEGNTLIIN